jgi:FkbM family methyltransferase
MTGLRLVGLLIKNPKEFGKRVFVRVKEAVLIYIVRDINAIDRQRWIRDEGDKGCRLNYSLNENSVVVDVGGYVGDYANDLYNKYGCEVYLFEPSEEFFKQCVERFKNIPKIHCYNYGLSDVDGEFTLSNDEAGSSLSIERIANGGKIVKIRRFDHVFLELKLKKVDLIKINIEGGEFQLLPHIIDSGLIKKIDNLQIQFHEFIQDGKHKRKKIINSLRKTHSNSWLYMFIWESWEVKK